MLTITEVLRTNQSRTRGRERRSTLLKWLRLAGTRVEQAQQAPLPWEVVQRPKLIRRLIRDKALKTQGMQGLRVAN